MRIAVILLFFLGPALASETLLTDAQLDHAAKLRDEALQSDLAWTILESLTTEVGPRSGGSEGDARAVAWGQAKFSELGFDRIWTEPVTFPHWTRGHENAQVIAPYPQPLVITALGGSVGTPDAGVEAELAHFETLEQLSQAPDGSLDGRIVFISNRMKRARDGSGYGPAVVARSKGASVAASKGAIGLLIRSIGTDDDRTPHTGTMRYAEGIGRIPAAAVSNPDADLLVRMLRREQPVTVRMQLGADTEGEATSYNVIGEITGGARAEELVVIGCHLDSWDLGTGAIDDGAGCAITMATAALLGRQEDRPSRTIRVVLWANEEQGLWGARAYAEAHKGEIDRHVIGSESDFGAGRIYRIGSRVKPEALPLIHQILGVLAPLDIDQGDNESGGGPDLMPMHQRGMATVRLFQDGSDYFDYHHTANDTLDKVDPEHLKQNLAAWTVFVDLAAEAPGDFGFGLGLPAEQ